MNQIQKMRKVDLQSAFKELTKASQPIEEFKRGIPELAKIVGVVEFIKTLGLTKPKYYRRLNGTIDWSQDELLKVKKILDDLSKSFS
jgi:hypothetical protein